MTTWSSSVVVNEFNVLLTTADAGSFASTTPQGQLPTPNHNEYGTFPFPCPPSSGGGAFGGGVSIY